MINNILLPSLVADFFDNFDSLFRDVSVNGSTSFPKYNIVKKSDEEIVLELAIAGYTEKDVKIEVKNNILIVSGEKQEDNNKQYLHKELANRGFYKKWTLPRNIEVGEAKLENGILYITCKLFIPEHEKPKLIPIKTDKTLLT